MIKTAMFLFEHIIRANKRKLTMFSLLTDFTQILILFIFISLPLVIFYYERGKNGSNLTLKISIKDSTPEKVKH